MSSSMIEHFAMLSPDVDKPEEDITSTLLGVLGYSAQSISLHPEMAPKIIKHMRGESLRIKSKLGIGAR